MNIQRASYWGVDMKKVLLIDIDSHNFPNLSLMKLSAFLKQNDNDVDFIKLTKADKTAILNGQPMWFDNEYDSIYGACVFTDNRNVAIKLHGMGVMIGGTGVSDIDDKNIIKKLAPEIEHIYPDYGLYDEFKDIAYGFLTRGCPRSCPFCIVSGKEGNKSIKVADLYEFYEDQSIIKLLDPNILACDEHINLLEQLVESKAWIDFTQGLDARCTNLSNLKLIQQMKIKMIHFAWDNPRTEKMKDYLYFIRQNLNYRPEKMRVYVLTNYWSSFDDDLNRVYWLRDNGFEPYVMIYDKPNAPKNVKKLQRYVNCKYIFKSIDRFEDYYSGNWKYKKE